MACPMAGDHMPGCNCPIKVWCNKKMFMAHWLIYHIDQHISHLSCDVKNDDVRRQYMTDREADMKHHVMTVHEAKYEELIMSNAYVKENAWLDLTSSGPSRTYTRTTRPSLKWHKWGQHPFLLFG